MNAISNRLIIGFTVGLPIIVAAACLTGGADRATAAQITQSQALDVDTGQTLSTTPIFSASQTFDFTLFDTTKGTLTGVDVELLNSAINLNATIVATNVSAGAGIILGLDAGQAIIEGMPTPFVASLPANKTASCSPAAGATSCTGSAMSSSSDALLSEMQSDLAAFEGTGTISFGAGLTLAQIGPIVTPSGAMANLTGSFVEGTWTGTVDVIYTYTPSASPVPEPASLGVLTAALATLAALGLYRRRGRPWVAVLGALLGTLRVLWPGIQTAPPL